MWGGWGTLLPLRPVVPTERGEMVNGQARRFEGADTQPIIDVGQRYIWSRVYTSRNATRRRRARALWFFAFLLALAAVVVSMALFVKPASAGTVRTYGPTYVDYSAASTWYQPLQNARRFLEPYTHRSYTVTGGCRAGYKCVVIRECWGMNDSHAAETTFTSWFSTYYDGRSRVRICLNPTRRGYSDTLQTRILAHELAHAHGVWWHSSYCGNVVSPSVSCTRLYVLSDQRARLYRN